MRYHFTDAYARDKSETSSRNNEGLADRAEVIFTLMRKFSEFDKTALYINFCNAVVKYLKGRLKRGHILLNGTNATLFGNGPELLKYIAGEEITSELKPAQIRCERFDNGTKLLCARSPHITMGNLYCVENNIGGDIWNYFDLGENIVCVNAIGENIQQRLNGCDYDSDSMLVTDDEMLVEVAEKYNSFFKVPVCNIIPSGKAETTLPETDHKISVNKIGEIVNLSQKLNSLIWDKLNNGASAEEIMPIYEDVCKLAVLSGIEIDKAKRAFNNISVGSELYKIRTKYNMANPMFFKDIDDGRGNKKYTYYNSTMDYIVKYMKKVHFRDGREQYDDVIPISHILYYNDYNKTSATDYRHKDKVVALCEEYKIKINQLYQEIRTADDQEIPVLYDMIADVKAERDKKVAKWLTSDAVLMLVIKHYEKNDASDWRIYAALINNPLFENMLFEL